MSVVLLADRAEGIRCHDATHVSYSRSKRWDECGWKAHALDDLGIVDHFTAPAVIGSAVDAAITEIVGDPGQWFAADGDLAAGVVAFLDAQLEEAHREIGNPARKVEAEDQDKARRLLDLWAREVYPVLPPVWATQLELHFTVPGTSITAHVHLDAVLEDGTIVDWKTSKARLGDRRADHDPQLTWYSLALREVYGHEPGPVALVGLIDTKTIPDDVFAGLVAAGTHQYPVKGKPPGPWVDWQRSTRTDEQLDALVAEIARREEARKWARRTGIYQTTGRTSMFACTNCPAKPICPSWAGYPIEELTIVTTTEGAA